MSSSFSRRGNGGAASWITAARVRDGVAERQDERAMPMPLRTGIVIGQYRLRGKLAAGGMAEVFEAEHVVLPRKVALKVMHLGLMQTAGIVARFLREACILETFTHPGGLRVFECGVLPDGRPWMAMELVIGTPLSIRMQLPMDPDAVTAIVATVCEVLAAAHAAGLIHRDLKPANLLLSTATRAYAVRVIDWGLALEEQAVRVTRDGLTCGTPLYMAPEQAMGRSLDCACDIYSLGVVAYEALAGVPPYVGTNLAQLVVEQLTTVPVPLHLLRTDVPPELSALIGHMLTKDPRSRPGAVEVGRRASALLAALRQTSAPVSERPADYESMEIATQQLGVDSQVEPAPTVGQELGQAPAPGRAPQAAPDLPRRDSAAPRSGARYAGVEAPTLVARRAPLCQLRRPEAMIIDEPQDAAANDSIEVSVDSLASISATSPATSSAALLPAGGASSPVVARQRSVDSSVSRQRIGRSVAYVIAQARRSYCCPSRPRLCAPVAYRCASRR